MRHRVPWARAWAEGAIVLVSILLAFGIEAWWSESQAKAYEAELLLAVAAELDANSSELSLSIQVTEDRLALMERFLEQSPAELAGEDPDSVRRLVMGLPNAPRFEAQIATAELLAETAVTSSQGIRLKSWVRSWLRQIVWVESEAALLRERHNLVQEELVRHAHDQAMPLSAALPEIVARSSPDILTELREDRSLLEVVLLKRHTQQVYLKALQGLRTLLEDSPRTEGAGGTN